VANQVFDTLVSKRRFEPEDVVYLNKLDGWSAWWENVQVTDTEVTVERLQREIMDARQDNIERHVPLLLFLAGHGGLREFQLAEGEILKAEDLKSWFDELVAAKATARSVSAAELPADEIIVVVDFCFSRTFLEIISGPGRVVIGSSSNERSSVIDGTSFAATFFRWLSRGTEEANLWRSFEEAREQVLSVFPQAPYMDVDGDGISLIDERGNIVSGQEKGVELARQMFVGGEIGGKAITLGAEPEIYRVAATPGEGGDFDIEALGDPGLEGLSLSFAVLGDTGQLPQPGTGLTGDLEAVDAIGDTTIYRGEVTFPETGEYVIVILGKDGLGNFAGQRQLFVSVQLGPPGDFDGDGSVGFTDFLLFAQHFGLVVSDDGWDQRFDLDGDGEVGFTDFIAFAAAFGSQ
jgi:hypothetical protein